MAEDFFNQMAKGRAKGFSAGTQPADQVNPLVVEVMREIGIDSSVNKPKALTMDMVEKADKMITMGCVAKAESICLASFIETEDLKLDDPKGKPIEEVRLIRDEVKTKVTTLIEKLT